MSIVRAKRSKNFSVISNAVFSDGVLSFQAMGLLAYLLSKPDNWKISPAQLAEVTSGTAKKTGKEGVYNILKELKNAGYIETKKHASGQLDYLVYDEPQSQKPHTAKPDQAKPKQGKPDTANPNQGKPNQAEPPLINTDLKQELRNRSSVEFESNTTVSEPANELRPEVTQIIQSLNSVTGSRFQAKGSNAKLINARLAEGHSVNDLTAVIHHKAQEWGRDAKMCQYLRPSTLFQAAKFPGYLQQAQSVASGHAVQRSGGFVPDNNSTDWINGLHDDPLYQH